MAGIQIAVGGLVLLASLLILLAALGVYQSTAGLDSRIEGTGLGALIAFGLFMVGVVIVAQGQLLEVFLQIEENTRKQ